MTDFNYNNYAIPEQSEAPLWTTLPDPSEAAPRWRWLPVLFAAPALLCGVSWLADGVAPLTDAGMILLTLLCAACVISELISFSRRFGTGGLTLFGGTIVWFCYDYIVHWSFSPGYMTGLGNNRAVVAKDAFFVCVLVMMMVAGLNFKGGRWADRLMVKLPELRNPDWAFWVMIAVFLFGISPYVFFTHEPFYLAIFHAIVGARSGHGTEWLGGRTGNLNYNWSGYIAQILAVGQVGSIYGIFYAVLLARNRMAKIVGWAIWVLWLMLGFGSGTRGQVIAQVLPLILVLFIKFHSQGSRISLRAYLSAMILLICTIVLVQFQITFRNTGFVSADVSAVHFTDIQGNAMFSEGMAAFRTVPDQHDYFNNRYYIEGIVRPIPEKIFWFFVMPMPRALWTTKPLDPVAVWYNVLSTGESNGATGTTISSGLAAHWYIRYGIFGLMEGGFLVGWLMRVGERALQQSSGRLNLLLLALAWEVWLFRCFRDFYYSDLYDPLIGISILALFSWFANIFSESSPAPAMAQPSFSA